MKRATAVALLASLILVGCAAYRLGPPENTPSGQSLYIAPVTNRSQTPQIRGLLTQQLREVFLRDGQWTLTDDDTASHRLEVTVVERDFEGAATRQEDTGRSVSFEQILIVQATLTGSSLPEPLSADFEMRGLALESPSLPESAFRSLPSLTRRTAEAIYDRMTFGR